MNLFNRVMNVLGSRDTAHLGASRTAREVTGWEPSSGSPESDLNEQEQELLRSRGRDLDRNSGLASNLKRTTVDNLIGTGLQWQPTPNFTVLNNDSDWAMGWARKAKAEWNDYSGSEYFDADGTNNFHLHTQLIARARFTDGESVILPMWRSRPGTSYRTCFKIVEADRLCNPQGKENTETLIDGVKYSKAGEVLGYHIMNTHPGSNDSVSETWTYIPAQFPSGRKRFIHVYKKDRPGQARGKSAVSAVMAAFGLRGKYQLTELQAAEVASRIAGVMETPLTDEQAQNLFGGKSDDYAKLRKTWNGKLTSGMILKLPPGTKYQTHIPNRPATAYVGFMDHISREIGIAVGMPDQLSLRDFTKVNYSSARAALLEAWRGFYVERAEIAFQWADKAVALWMEEAIDLGRIEAPEFQERRTAYCCGKWLGKGMQPIDRLKHENANKTALEIGTTTLRDIYAEDGEDWEEQLRQRHREAAANMRHKFEMKKLQNELEKEFEFDMPNDSAPQPDEGDPPLSDEEIDEADAKEDPPAEPIVDE